MKSNLSVGRQLRLLSLPILTGPLDTYRGYGHILDKEGDQMRQELSVSIEGMHCGACVRRVTNALQSVVGVQTDSVEIGSARMTFDPAQATPESILAAVNGIGFHAHLDQ
jgi:copper chaperone